MKKVIFWFLIITSFKLQAQPGGGGGLIIKKIYDKNLKEIMLDKDSIQVELLALDSVMTILNKHKIQTKQTIGLFIAPLNNYRHSNKASGILITYKNNQYRIDFENILTQNGAGYREKIDSLVLFKPYILSKRDYYHPSDNANEFRDYSLLRDLSNMYLNHGITPYTYNKLFALDLIFDSKDYSYNRKPKIWMEDFKNLYGRYTQHNYTHTQKEIETFLEELQTIIKKNGINEAFVLFKMKLLYKTNSYKEIINLYQKYPIECSIECSINDMLIDCYTKCKDYNKSITVCEKAATIFIDIYKEKYYKYMYHKFFIEIYYLDKNQCNQIQTILDNEKYSQYYQYIFQQIKILQAYNTYKFENKKKGLEQMNIYDKKCIPNPILKHVYLTVPSDKYDYCPSLIFGINSEIF